LNRTYDFFGGGYILKEEDMKPHYIITEHGALMEYEINIFLFLGKLYFHS